MLGHIIRRRDSIFGRRCEKRKPVTLAAIIVASLAIGVAAGRFAALCFGQIHTDNKAAEDRGLPVPNLEKVFDCTLFNGEFDMLEVRLLTLNSFVDFFVIVESNISFSGRPKPLYLQEALTSKANPVVTQFEKKIVPVSFSFPITVDAWARERASHVAKRQGLELRGARQIDWVILADIDEIPHPAWAKRVISGEWGDSVGLKCDFFYYHSGWLNSVEFGAPAFRRYGQLNTDRTFFTSFRNSDVEIQGAHACWHCSNCFGPTKEDAVDKLVNKIQSFSHTEYDQPNITDRSYLRQCISNGISPFSPDQFIQVDPDMYIPFAVKIYSRYSFMRGLYTFETERNYSRFYNNFAYK